MSARDFSDRAMADAADMGDDEDVSSLIDVSVRCPHCPVVFEGCRDEVEQDLFDHIWKMHEDPSIEFMLQNMYVPEHIKATIYEEMGPDYISWIVDTNGEIVKQERPEPPKPRKTLK